MNNPPIVIVDSDGIVAQSNLTDANHDLAIRISEELVNLGAKVIYPSTTIFEATTTIARKFNNSKMAAGTLSIFSDPSMIIEPVDQSIVVGATKYYDPNATKKNTTFDAAVAAIADKYKADYIFGFDSFYEKKGFKLAKNLLKKK
jgi:predicted nucleic acid-binding protein